VLVACGLVARDECEILCHVGGMGACLVWGCVMGVCLEGVFVGFVCVVSLLVGRTDTSSVPSGLVSAVIFCCPSNSELPGIKLAKHKKTMKKKSDP